MGTLKNQLGTAGVLAPAGDKYKIALIIGPTSAGPINEPALVANQPTLRETFKYGRGASFFNRLLEVTDEAHYFCRCASTPGTVGAVTKTPSGPAVPYTLEGSAIVAGDIPPVGGVRYALKDGQSGVSVHQITGGSNSIVVTHPTAGTTLITITSTAASQNNVRAPAISADAGAAVYITAAAVGGSGDMGVTASPVVLDNGGMVLSAKALGVSFSVVVSGNNTPLSIVESSGAVAIHSATDANGLQTSTPNSVKTYLDTNPAAAAALAKLDIAVVGSGAGLVTAIGSTPLQLGSTGSMTLSGTPAIGAHLVVVVQRGGALGAFSVRWTADGDLEHLGPEQFVDGTGILALVTDNVDLGLTATFTGVHDVDDRYDATITDVTVAAADVLAAFDACLAAQIQVGCVSTSEPLLTASAVLQFDAKLQAAWDTHQMQGVFAARPRNLGASESKLAYQAALAAEYASALSDGGLVSLVAANCRRDTDLADGFIDSYTGLDISPPFLFPAFPRFMVGDAHEDAGWVGGGSLDGVLYVDYDERLTPGLSWRPNTGGAKFWAPTTYAGLSPAEIFIDAAITRFKGTQAQFRMASWVRLACQVGFIASKASLIFVQGNLSWNENRDATGAPAGALTPASRDRVVREVNDPVREFLMEVKPRTVLASANDQPEFVDAPRDYDYGGTQELRLNYEFTPENVTLVVKNTIRVKAR